jgi:hypothetical protein
MRVLIVAFVAVATFGRAEAQAPGKWPSDSLVNVQVIPKTPAPVQVWGMMRNIAGALGVSCTFCHVGADSAPLGADRLRQRPETEQARRAPDDAPRAGGEQPARYDPGATDADGRCDVRLVARSDARRAARVVVPVSDRVRRA